jgi:hypothetical protein
MRRINKTVILAKQYKDWLDDLTKNNKQHPSYNSSNGRFYYDIVANLIWVQSGLCAYSERWMQDHTLFEPGNWMNGKFKKFEFSGQLDHFDCSQKDNLGWLWDNFFLIDSDINVKIKKTNQPSGILKPDLTNFNAADYLEYDPSIHCFIPKRTLDFDVQEKVLRDISYLGLNFQPIIDIRRQYLAPLIEDVKYELKTYEEVKRSMHQFFTAFELLREYMKE